MLTIALNPPIYDPHTKYDDIKEENLQLQPFNKKELYSQKSISINLGICIGSFLIGGLMFGLVVFFLFSSTLIKVVDPINTSASHLFPNSPSIKPSRKSKPSGSSIEPEELSEVLQPLSEALEGYFLKEELKAKNIDIEELKELLNQANMLIPYMISDCLNESDLKKACKNEPQKVLEQLEKTLPIFLDNKTGLQIVGVTNIEDVIKTTKDLIKLVKNSIDNLVPKVIDSNLIQSNPEIPGKVKEDKIKPEDGFSEQEKLDEVRAQMYNLQVVEVKIYEKELQESLKSKYLSLEDVTNKNYQQSYTSIYERKMTLNKVINNLDQIIEYFVVKKNNPKETMDASSSLVKDIYITSIVKLKIVLQYFDEQEIPSVEEKTKFEDKIDYTKLSIDFLAIIEDLEEQVNDIIKQLNENKLISPNIFKKDWLVKEWLVKNIKLGAIFEIFQNIKV